MTEESGLPHVNSLVRVAVDPEDLQGYPSRVEAVATAALAAVSAELGTVGVVGSRLAVAAPSFAGDLLTADEGLPVLVRWTVKNGVASVQAELERVEHGEVTTWVVRVTSAVEHLQRRRFARARATTPLHLVPLRDAPSPVLPGWVSDLSEGGLRGRVTGKVTPGERVTAHVQLDELHLRTIGEVLDIRASGRHGELEVVVRFEEPVREEDLIRRWVLRQQVLARRTMEEQL